MQISCWAKSPGPLSQLQHERNDNEYLVCSVAIWAVLDFVAGLQYAKSKPPASCTELGGKNNCEAICGSVSLRCFFLSLGAAVCCRHVRIASRLLWKKAINKEH